MFILYVDLLLNLCHSNYFLIKSPSQESWKIHCNCISKLQLKNTFILNKETLSLISVQESVCLPYGLYFIIILIFFWLKQVVSPARELPPVASYKVGCLCPSNTWIQTWVRRGSCHFCDHQWNDPSGCRKPIQTSNVYPAVIGCEKISQISLHNVRPASVPGWQAILGHRWHNLWKWSRWSERSVRALAAETDGLPSL